MRTSKLLLCVRNTGYEASLERRKLYEAVPDRDAAAHRLVRVIDESGEDYLYPAALFTPVKLPVVTRRAAFSPDSDRTIARVREAEPSETWPTAKRRLVRGGRVKPRKQDIP
jgi:hypothetical protein